MPPPPHCSNLILMPNGGVHAALRWQHKTATYAARLQKRCQCKYKWYLECRTFILITLRPLCSGFLALNNLANLLSSVCLQCAAKAKVSLPNGNCIGMCTFAFACVCLCLKFYVFQFRTNDIIHWYHGASKDDLHI